MAKVLGYYLVFTPLSIWWGEALAQHGWNKAATRAQKQKVIKTYNRIDIYANTILGLAEAQGYVAE